MFTIEDVLTATQGNLLQGSRSGKVRGVCIDSRAIRQGDLFVAIKGEKFDGHDFIPKVTRQGVRILLVHRPIQIKDHRVVVILVDDTTKALGRLARFHRLRFDIPVVAITGSAGKTTTKEMIAAVLKKKFKVLASEGNQNNHIGVPLTLLKLRQRHEAAVIEMGTNQPGDIVWLAEIACPTIAVMANIGESHLEKLKTLDGVYREKMNLARAVSSNGYIVFNADDIYLRKIPKGKLAGRLMPYSIQTKSRNTAVNVRIENPSGLNFVVDKKIYFLRSFSVDMAYNALAAIVCARLLKVSVGDIQDALGKFRFERGRQEIFKRSGVVIINDSYNANLVSMRSAISMLGTYPALGRRILICADMLELGKRSKALHQRVGECVAQSKTNVLMTLGDQARLILETAHRRNPQLIVFHFPNMEDLKNYLYVLCRRGDVVLVKGSRLMKMEDVVNGLLKELKN